MAKAVNLCDLFDQTCKKYSQLPAFTCMGQTLTFAEVDTYTTQFASYLQNHTNLKPGDRIAIQMPNLLQYPIAVYGALKAGLIVVNTNPLYTDREIKHQLNDSGAKALLVLANIAKEANEVVKDTPVETVIVTEVADLHPFLKRHLLNFVVKRIKKMVPEVNFENRVSFTDALKLGAASTFKPGVTNPEDIAILQYTGGTTGVAKGAMLSHRNLIANRGQIVDHLEEVMKEGEEIYIAPLPLYHIYAFNFHCVSLFSRGSLNILIPNPRDLPALLGAIKKVRFTGFVGLDTLFKALCNNEQFKSLDFSALRTTSSGGMALTRDTAELWQKITGVTPNEGYGLTETSPVVSANYANAIKPGTVGVALPHTEVKTVDENGQATAIDEPGELLVRGPQVMEGYWQRPEETAKNIDAEGWFATGDIATIDEAGYIRIVDRKKDMILVSGFNVYPAEVEDVIVSHPKVLEAAVIGVPDARSGEAVKVFVVKKDATLTDKDVISYARDNLTAYKVPKKVEFCEDLPKSNVGKVLRKELRSQ
ncbi:AMP-binding protein [Halioxenophilus aromaticivorans]|uniref:Long-chain-fatty-acid--CoA ligase n=1 Tax=Halioxenophilus aromaticivorans TaxID=1306992 RepID=A0AAV3TW85_9ALTE